MLLLQYKFSEVVMVVGQVVDEVEAVVTVEPSLALVVEVPRRPTTYPRLCEVFTLLRHARRRDYDS